MLTTSFLRHNGSLLTLRRCLARKPFSQGCSLRRGGLQGIVAQYLLLHKVLTDVNFTISSNYIHTMRPRQVPDEPLILTTSELHSRTRRRPRSPLHLLHQFGQMLQLFPDLLYLQQSTINDHIWLTLLDSLRPASTLKVHFIL